MFQLNKTSNACRKARDKSRSQTGATLLLLVALLNLTGILPARAILAGDENALPADSPVDRLDPLGAASSFNAIGSLSISAGGFSYIGSAPA